MSKREQHNAQGKGAKNTISLVFTILDRQWSLHPDVFDEVRVHGHGRREWKVCSASLQRWAEELHQGVPGEWEIDFFKKEITY